MWQGPRKPVFLLASYFRSWEIVAKPVSEPVQSSGKDKLIRALRKAGDFG